VTSYVVNSDGGFDRGGAAAIDSNAIKLLLSFDSLRQLDPSGYGSSTDPVSAQILSLRKATAFLILAGKLPLGGLPVGMDSTTVVAQILVVGSKSGSSIAVLAKTVGLSATSLEALAVVLFQSGVLKPTDSSSLYPPYPVRVRSAMSVSGPLTAGGAAVAVNGAFAWTKGYRVSGEYLVKTANGTASGFQFLVQKPIQLSDTNWTLSDNFSLLAPSDAATGTDTLVVTLSDDSGHVATARAAFQVVAKETPKPDTIAPNIALAYPTTDTSVPNSVQTLVVEVVATDSVGVDSVKINGVKLSNSPYSVSVPLAIGINTVTAQAWDKSGNASKTISVSITRANSPGDTVAPRIVRSSPKGKDTTVDYTTSTATLAYLVTDDSLLASVSLDGKALSSTTGLYQAVVDLPVGSKSFVLLALDKHGNPARDTVTVTRRKDTTKPVVALGTPSIDTTVSFKTTGLTISVVATDIAGIDSVKIGGIKSASTASPYAATVVLALGANTISIEAFDKFGNSAGKQLVVTRAQAPDSIAPVIVRTVPVKDSATVSATTASFDLAWTVSDDSTLASVTLNGTALSGTAGVYRSTQSVDAGTKLFIVEAKDARGNSTRDTVVVTRLTDPSKPAATWQGGSKDTAVWAYVPSISATWKVTDNALKLVTINGAAVSGSNELYTQTVILATDTTWIRLMALDSSSNTLWDSVRVVRKYDKTPPTVAFQKTKSRLVANAVAADTLVWTVSDNLKLKSVKMNGADLTVSGNKYSSIVSLPVGTNRYVLVATDSAGNLTTDSVVVARTALAPTHSAAAGNYIGTVYDTLKSPGADSIVYSTDLSSWAKAKGPVALTTSKTVYAKALPGDQIVPVSFVVSQVKSVAMGGDDFIGQAFSLFVMADGSGYASGSNQGGAFGISSATTIFAHSPIKVVSGISWAAATSNYSTQSLFVMKTDNTIYAAGSGGAELGLGPTASSAMPFTRVYIDDVASITAGGGDTYFRKSDGTVWMPGVLDATPVQVPGLAHMASITSGALRIDDYDVHGAGVDSMGQVWHWKYRDSTDWEASPIVTIGILVGPEVIATGAKDVVIGGGQLLILKKDGTVLAEGANSYGQLGLGTVDSPIPYLSQINGLSNIVAITAGTQFSLFLRNDNSLLIAGMIMTYSPPPTGKTYSTPTVIGNDVSAVWAGTNSFIFKKKDGTIWGAGWNNSGGLGLGTNDAAALPTQINF
jgi:alpha-tubulin suppressor-like RCC1 family protein